MEDEARDGDGDGSSTAASGIVSHRSDSPDEIKPTAETVDGVDILSTMPDEILHHIISFVPTEIAITTSVLSKRWRPVWRGTHSLDFDDSDETRRTATAREINQTLISSKASKLTSFHLRMTESDVSAPQMDSWIDFAMSRNVENMSLSVNCKETHSLPDVLYLSSSLEQLTISVEFDMIPSCTVSWNSLRKLKLRDCNLYDKPFANILSGCPVLETLSLFCCGALPKRLDLSKSPSVKRLEIYQLYHTGGPMKIIAPHIHYLSMRSSEELYPLVDVSSLTEATLDVFLFHQQFPLYSNANFLQTMVLKVLAKLQNVERLTFDGTVLQILSLAALRGVPFPTLKVQTLTLETALGRSVIPGIERLLQNSPGLKKLTAHATHLADIADRDVDNYLDSQGLNPTQNWRSIYEAFPKLMEYNGPITSCKRAMSKLVASYMEMLLRNANTIETLVVGLKCIDSYDAKWFDELRQMVFNNNNVSIVFRR